MSEDERPETSEENEELEPLTTRVPARLADFVRARAKKEKRSLSSQIEKFIEEALEREKRAS